jgi:hypothetical protein
MKKFIDCVKSFLKSLFDVTSNTDEKIVVGFMSFAMMIFMAVTDQFTSYKVNTEIFYSFVGLTFACFSLGVYAGIKSTDAKTTVATEIVKSDASSNSNDAAKDVLQAEKPQS